MNTLKRGLLIGLVALLPSLGIHAQIRDFIVVVRPVYHEETVSFLNKLSDSMKADGYEMDAEALKSYASGGFGSGFLVQDGNGKVYVMTNRHVVAQASTITIEQEKRDGSQVVYRNCQVLALDENLDLALVALPPDQKTFAQGLEFSTSPVDDGTEVWSAGYPGLGATPSWQLGKGNVTNAIAKVPELAKPSVTSLIQHSAMIDPGNSGGPLLELDRASPGGYRVLGINTWKAVSRQATNFAIPAKAIQAFLALALDRQEEQVPQPVRLEARSRGFLGALASGSEAYKAMAQFISYGYVARAGEAILKDVLLNAPREVKDEILAVFVGASPIEGIRLAIAYSIQASLEGKDGMLPLVFRSVEGNAEAPQGQVPVHFSREGKMLALDWVLEHGVWRISAYPLPASLEDKAARGPGTRLAGTKGWTFGDKPFRGLAQIGTNVPMTQDQVSLMGISWCGLVSSYLGATLSLSADAGNSFVSYSNAGLYKVSVGGRLQYPIQGDALLLLPFAGLNIGTATGLTVITAGGSSFYLEAEGGLQLGFGPAPRLFLGLSFSTYLNEVRYDSGSYFSLSLALGY